MVCVSGILHVMVGSLFVHGLVWIHRAIQRIVEGVERPAPQVLYVEKDNVKLSKMRASLVL